MRTAFWETIGDYLALKNCARVDSHHHFGPTGELIVDRSSGAPLADSRVVHYDPQTPSYVIFTGERVRFNTLDGVTVFQETSPWDTQVREDPPVNFHVRIESAGRTPRGLLSGPILYPRTAQMDRATLRNISVFTPTGLAWHARELGFAGKPAVRVGLRFGLHGEELLLSAGAQNISGRPIRVSLISFFLPLLTRGFSFNAESPWWHEGWAVPGKGILIRSTEEGIACAIRYCFPRGSRHCDNTSTLAYYGGMDRSAAHPAAVGPGEIVRQAHSGFVAPACAHTEDQMVLGPGRSADLHYAVRAFPSPAGAQRHLNRGLTAGEVDRNIAKSERRAGRLYGGARLDAPSRAFSCSHAWLKQQVSGCARIRSRFRLFWNYLLGVRDKAQAGAAAVDFDAATGRRMILELSGQQFEDGRFPRQYSFDGAYDLRYFMDSGLWLSTMLIPHYLKCTGDFDVLTERAGYKRLRDWDPARRTGRVEDSPRNSTVLDHLIENVDHVVSNRDPRSGLVNIRDGDWNDAIGLIQNSTMVLEQLYQALGAMEELHRHLPDAVRRTSVGKRLSKKTASYRRLQNDLHRAFIRRLVQMSPDGCVRIIHGYTPEGRTVGGFWDSDGVVTERELARALGGRVKTEIASPFRDAEGRTLYKLHRRWIDPACRRLRRLPESARRLFLANRVSATPLAFAVLSGILRHRSTGGHADRLEQAIGRDARALDSPYGFKTFSVPFNRFSKELRIGRIGNLDGAENASPYVHAGMFLCDALYKIGRWEQANEFVDKTLPINRALHARQNRGINYIPNSWGIGPKNDGASMNDFHTNSAAIFSRLLVEEIVGLKVTYEGIEIQPIPRLPATMGQAPSMVYTTTLRGRRIRLIHTWSPAATDRSIRFHGALLALTAPAPRGIPCARLRWGDLKAAGTNAVEVQDPLPVS